MSGSHYVHQSQNAYLLFGAEQALYNEFLESFSVKTKVKQNIKTVAGEPQQ